MSTNVFDTIKKTTKELASEWDRMEMDMRKAIWDSFPESLPLTWELAKEKVYSLSSDSREFSVFTIGAFRHLEDLADDIMRCKRVSIREYMTPEEMLGKVISQPNREEKNNEIFCDR
jgi:hypothetical protein